MRSENLLKGARGDPYITRENFDLFFSKFVSTYDCTYAHAKKNVYAIKYYSKNVEHVGMKEICVNSNEVKIALDRVKKNYLEELKNREFRKRGAQTCQVGRLGQGGRRR